MKPCPYCGRDNASPAEVCFECGTALRFNTAGISQSVKPPSPKARLVVGSAAGGFLILSALLWVILRAAFDVAAAGIERPIGRPGVYGVGIVAFIYALPFLLPAIVIGLPAIFGACVQRCEDGLLGSVAWLLALGGLLAVVVVGELRLLVPAVMLGKLLNSSIASHIASAGQFAMGIWLLGGWSRKRQGETPMPGGQPPIEANRKSEIS